VSGHAAVPDHGVRDGDRGALVDCPAQRCSRNGRGSSCRRLGCTMSDAGVTIQPRPPMVTLWVARASCRSAACSLLTSKDFSDPLRGTKNSVPRARRPPPDAAAPCQLAGATAQFTEVGHPPGCAGFPREFPASALRLHEEEAFSVQFSGAGFAPCCPDNVR
jgi:hypothetical protein